jgi:hypothetical protein
MRHLLIILALVLVTLAAVGIPAGLIYLYSSSEDRQKRFLNEFLSAADLRVDNETWSALQRFAHRRARWGAIGGGVGFAVGLPIAEVLDPGNGDAATMFNVAMLFGGLAFGNALSTQMSAHLSDDVPRVSMLQERSIKDYLPMRAIVAEAVVAVLSVLTSIAGLVLLGTALTSKATAIVVLGTGLLVGATSGLAVLLQRRLVRAPVRAEGPSQLVAHDVRLALGLRDLVGVSLSTAVLCGYGLLLRFSVPAWITYVLFALLLGIARLLYDPKPIPPKVPRAHEVAAMYPA